VAAEAAAIAGGGIGSVIAAAISDGGSGIAAAAGVAIDTGSPTIAAFPVSAGAGSTRVISRDARLGFMSLIASLS